MSEERNQLPSQKRLQRAQEEGLFARTDEIVSSCMLLFTTLLLAVFSETLHKDFKELFIGSFRSLREPTLKGALSGAFYPLLWPMTFILLSLLTLGITFEVVFRGGIFIIKQERKTSLQRASFFYRLPYRLGVGVLKVVLLLVLYYLFLHPFFPFPKGDGCQWVFFFALFSSLLLVVLALSDLFYEKWLFKHRLKTTVNEQREEKREQEGDDLTKHRRKRR